MKKSEEPLEEHIRGRFAQWEATPAPDAWEQISGQLPAGGGMAKTRLKGLVAAALLLLLLGFGGGWYMATQWWQASGQAQVQTINTNTLQAARQKPAVKLPNRQARTNEEGLTSTPRAHLANEQEPLLSDRAANPLTSQQATNSNVITGHIAPLQEGVPQEAAPPNKVVKSGVQVPKSAVTTKPVAVASTNSMIANSPIQNLTKVKAGAQGGSTEASTVAAPQQSPNTYKPTNVLSYNRMALLANQSAKGLVVPPAGPQVLVANVAAMQPQAQEKASLLPVTNKRLKGHYITVMPLLTYSQVRPDENDARQIKGLNNGTRRAGIQLGAGMEHWLGPQTTWYNGLAVSRTSSQFSYFYEDRSEAPESFASIMLNDRLQFVPLFADQQASYRYWWYSVGLQSGLRHYFKIQNLNMVTSLGAEINYQHGNVVANGDRTTQTTSNTLGYSIRAGVGMTFGKRMPVLLQPTVLYGLRVPEGPQNAGLSYRPVSFGLNVMVQLPKQKRK